MRIAISIEANIEEVTLKRDGQSPSWHFRGSHTHIRKHTHKDVPELPNLLHRVAEFDTAESHGVYGLRELLVDDFRNLQGDKTQQTCVCSTELFSEHMASM